MEVRYNEDGSIKARLTYTNDTVTRLKLSRVFERMTPDYSKQTAYYSYNNSNFLTGMTEKDEMGRVITQSNVVCDSNGHPVELALFDGKRNPYGKEVATYLYDSNMVISSVIGNNGATISTDTGKISFTKTNSLPREQEKYNANGDLTNWTSKNLNGSETIYEAEYMYDKAGNCTEERIYKITVKSNGKRKKADDRVFKKEYFY